MITSHYLGSSLPGEGIRRRFSVDRETIAAFWSRRTGRLPLEQQCRKCYKAHKIEHRVFSPTKSPRNKLDPFRIWYFYNFLRPERGRERSTARFWPEGWRGCRVSDGRPTCVKREFSCKIFRMIVVCVSFICDYGVSNLENLAWFWCNVSTVTIKLFL